MNLGICIHELELGNENEHIIAVHGNMEKPHNRNIGPKSQTPEKTHGYQYDSIDEKFKDQSNARMALQLGEWLLWVGE